MSRLLCASFLLVALVLPARAAPVDFNHDIQPILSDNCYHCHGPDEKARKAKLRLDTKEGAFRVKDGKAVIRPGDAKASELVRRITTDDQDDLMPPPDSHRKLTPQQIDLLKRWVAEGAKWGTHWAFVAPVRPQVPETKRTDWARNAIDSFVLAKLEAAGLKPSDEAAKRTLIRRVTLDLTGLPPKPEEVDAFLADTSADAYEKLVDRLLASPRYGERMVWEWLDAARYADSNGYQGDANRTMWPWRDWVIKAINANMPYDQFTVEQIAGDLIPNATTDQKIATGFLRNHMINGEGGRIPEENRVDYVMDQTETVGTVWLGLTVGCCRCHDHKFDPLAQKEYYQLYAFFNQTPVSGGGGSGQTAPVIDFVTAEQKARSAEFEKVVKERGDEVAEIEKDVFPHAEGQTASDSPAAQKLSGNISAELKRPPEKRYIDSHREIVNTFKESQPKYAEAVGKLRKAIEARDAYNASLPRVMVMQDQPKPRDTFILSKGSYDKPLDKVTTNVPAALPPLPAQAKHDRLALAKWLVSPENPLTARVTVNRFWQQFFGIGLVKTADDFGVQGEKPVHPELLDYLATEFVAGKWNVKALHRLIVTSATYRQSSKVTPELFERDPANRLMARGPRYRLPSPTIRDQALAASGLLVEKLGGPPVKPYQPSGIWEEATFGKIAYQQDHGDALYRRSVYVFWRRIVGPTMFFDVGSRQTCTVSVARTNTPLHALETLNDTTFVEAARALAQRIMKQGGPSAESRIDLAYRLLLARKPTQQEQSVLTNALARLRREYATNREAAAKLLSVGESPRDKSFDVVEHAAYTGVCTILLNLDETLTKE
jgi:hypothetical protein